MASLTISSVAPDADLCLHVAVRTMVRAVSQRISELGLLSFGACHFQGMFRMVLGYCVWSVHLFPRQVMWPKRLVTLFTPPLGCCLTGLRGLRDF